VHQVDRERVSAKISLKMIERHRYHDLLEQGKEPQSITYKLLCFRCYSTDSINAAKAKY
jgi:hypothetical protein